MDRPDDTSGLSAAPPEASKVENAGQNLHAAPDFGSGAAVLSPPRPLPARAFFDQPPAPADLPPPPEPPPERFAPRSPPGSEPLSPDDAFSAIDADASARSLSAVETAIAGALRDIQPHAPIEIAELPPRASPPAREPEPDLGRTIPQRMREPRLEIAPPASAFDSLRADPDLRPRPLSSPPPLIEPKSQPARDYWDLARRAIKLVAWLAIGWLALVLVLLVAYRFVNPPASSLMVWHWLTGDTVVQNWVPFDEISPNVVRAVVLSEDGRFCQHSGIDLEAIEDAIENSDGRSRGGSTVSMQVVKNLFLWSSKSYIRKAIELPLTFAMELLWPKRRIMEVYLNIAEWGPGIFGIGAAAQYHFHKTARALSVRDAARLAVSLPNPLQRNAGRPGPGLQRLANAIQVRMRLAPSSQMACVLPNRRY